MGSPAARMGDMHNCPMSDGPKPHVGGPVMAKNATVLIGGMPAAVVGDICTCTGPPDVILKGSAGVLICGMPAARMGDMTAHGGVIIKGEPTVLIGEAGGGGGAGSGGMGANAMKDALNKKALAEAAANGDGLAPKTEKDDLKAQFTLVDEAQKGISGVKYEIETSDGQKHSGRTDSSGKTQNITGVTSADCRVSFFNKS